MKKTNNNNYELHYNEIDVHNGIMYNYFHCTWHIGRKLSGTQCQLLFIVNFIISSWLIFAIFMNYIINIQKYIVYKLNQAK